MSSSSMNEPQVKDEQGSPVEDTFSARWTRAINRLHEPYLQHFLHPVTQFSGRNPKSTVSAVVLFSLGLLVLGLFTNFNVEVDGDLLWTPAGVRTVSHRDWIAENSGYPKLPRSMIFMVHANGDNVLDQQAVDGLFHALDEVRNLPGYDQVCQGTGYINPITNENTCEIVGPVKFWNDTAALFRASNEANFVTALSASVYPDGTPVSESDIYGFPQRDAATGLLQNVQSMTMVIDFPETDDAEDFETDAVDVVLKLADAWDKDNNNPFVLEILAERSFDDEIDAAIVADIPLVPIVFIVMGVFTAAIFARRDKVHSRSLLGFTAVVSVLLSIMSGYGLMFVCGIDFTSMTQLLPFVIFGIGLDDSFVIMGAYTRTNAVTMDPLERIHETMEEVGTSVTLTTLTSTLAFGLGCLASVPAVYWLCLYAIPTIAFVYLYQITFFVAAIVMDEKRIADNRRDCLTCCTVPKAPTKPDQDAQTEEQVTMHAAKPTVIERFIEWYAEFLLRPAVKVIVIVAFTALLGLCAWSASKLTQAFDVADVMPADSYVTDFLNARQDYTARSPVAPYAYFRYVNQSQPQVQEQMKAYVNDLVALDSIPDRPPFFWLDDFSTFVQENDDTVGQLSFNEQLDAFLALDEYRILYGPHIIRDEATGDILTSRVRLFMDNVELGEVDQEIDALEGQSGVADSQTLNQGRNDFACFMYDDIFQIWEFYAASVEELVLTTILGVVSVTGIALLFIPHWTAALFVLPMICILYVDLLGIMQWGGVTIDPVSYVTCVMSIGLLVDFIIHVLLRYYECPGNRREKTIAMLNSMGVSILTGGISTFLGTIPLAFSTSTIFQTIFIAFLGLSTIGVGHGLILLPVILSIVGPEDQIVRSKSSSKELKKTESIDQEDSVEAA